MFEKLFHKKAKKPQDETNDPSLGGIDAETLDVARMLVEERNMAKASRAKWKPGKGKGGGGSGYYDELLDALNRAKPNRQNIVNQIFARTVEDSTLANTFRAADGSIVRHLSVKKAVGMDGLRDIDGDGPIGTLPNGSGVGVSAMNANPANPEGRFRMPTFSGADHEFAERFSEAMNPRNSPHWNVIPELILEHFAMYSTFIGYPMCEVLGTHPTISNACTIPGQDAIAPGYKLQFIESEDINDNGVPDNLEVAELGGVKRSLERLASMEAMKNAITTLAAGEAHGIESLNALAVSLERLAAYEEWERSVNKDADAASAVHEGFVEPISQALTRFTKEPNDDATRKDAITALSVALSDLAKREHPSLDEVRSNNNRRGTILAVMTAYGTLSKPEPEWDAVRSLNDLAVAVERVAAYERFSDRNAAHMASLTMALTGLSERITPESKQSALDALSRAIAAMDEDDFDFEEPTMDGVSKKAENAQRQAAGIAQEEPQKDDFAGQRDHGGAPQPKAQGTEQSQGQTPQEMDGVGGMGGGQDPKMMAAMAAQMQAQQQQAQQQQAAEQKKQEEEDQRKKAVETAEIAQQRQRLLDEWKKRADDMGMNKVCERIVRNARMFGIGIAIPLVRGANYEEPFDVNKVTIDSYRGFTVVEPTWIYPETDSDDLVNPLSESFFEPTYWAVTGASNIGSLAIRRIHRSWLVICRHKEVPNMLRPMYYYGGLPLTQELYEPVFIADKLMNEVPKLAMTKRTTVVKGDPNDMITNPEGVVDRLQAFSQVQDNFGILYVGRNADVQKLETSLSEFDQLIAKANQRVASIAQMPESKLFKAQLGGAFQTGAYEMRDYWSLLSRIQENWLKPLLERHYRIDSKSRTGDVVELKITFNSPDVPTDSERSESESRTIQSINAAIQGGWLAPSEARIIARSSEDSMFSSISAGMPEELLQNQAAQQQGGGGGEGGGMPGMPGMGGGEGGGEGGGDNPLAALMGGGGGMPTMGGGNGGGKGGDLASPKKPDEPDNPKPLDMPQNPASADKPDEPKAPSMGAPSIAKMRKA